MNIEEAHAKGLLNDIPAGETITFLDSYDVDEAMNDRLIRLEQNVTNILETMSRIENMVTKTVEQVKPTLDELLNHPMLKMLGMGGKKK